MQNLQTILVVAPDFRHAQIGVEIELVKRATRNVYFDNHVRRRVSSRIEFTFADDTSRVLDEKAGVRLHSAWKGLLLKRGRTAAFKFATGLIRRYTSNVMKQTGVHLVILRWAHNPQPPSVVVHSSARAITHVSKQLFIFVPGDIGDCDHGALWQILDRGQKACNFSDRLRAHRNTSG